MDAAFEQRVRERAYKIWQAAGMDHGSADQHWLSAERSVLDEAEQMCSKTLLPAKRAKAGADTASGVKPPVVKKTNAAKMPKAKVAAKAAAPRKIAKMSAGASA